MRETKKALRDSERELEKMCIGHHIYDRGHELERHRNTRSGQTEEMQNYLNISESESAYSAYNFFNKSSVFILHITSFK